MTNYVSGMSEEDKKDADKQIKDSQLKHDQNLTLMARGFMGIPNNSATQYQVRKKRRSLEDVGHRNLHPLKYADQNPS